MHGDKLKERMNEAGAKREPFLFVLDFEMEEALFLENPLQQQKVLFDIRGCSNAPLREGITPSPHFEATPEDYDTYRSRFDTVMNGLMRGDSYLTNLTIRTPINMSLSLQDVFLFARTPYKLLLLDRFVCFSPECFVRMEDGKIHTFPMKGTIDARIPNARKTILSNPKEHAEHNTIVDLLRNDLSQIATDVSVKRFRYVEELQTHKGSILQVSSEIEGTLPPNYLSQLGNLFFKLLPAGSVSGAPKAATLALIRVAENEKRGYYTGIAGFFDGSRLDTFVLIRYIEQENSRYYFRSGGGITAQSDCRSEYKEALQKIYLPF